jgi:hypothetical protein
MKWGHGECHCENMLGRFYVTVAIEVKNSNSLYITARCCSTRLQDATMVAQKNPTQSATFCK